MHGVDDAARVVHAVEEVGVGERDVLRTRGDLLGDVAQHRVDRRDADPAVIDDGHRAVAATVGAAPARLDDGHQTFVVALHQSRVAIERRQQVPRRCHRVGGGGTAQVHHAAVVVSLDPVEERRVGLAGEDAIGSIGHGLAVEAEARDRKRGTAAAHVVDDLARQARRGVHRDGAREPVGPGHEVRVPRVDREVAAAHLVTGGPEAGRRLRDAERLTAELVTRHQRDAHRSRVPGGRRRHAMSTSRCACARRRVASTSAGVAPRAKRNPR